MGGVSGGGAFSYRPAPPPDATANRPANRHRPPAQERTGSWSFPWTANGSRPGTSENGAMNSLWLAAKDRGFD